MRIRVIKHNLIQGILLLHPELTEATIFMDFEIKIFL